MVRRRCYAQRRPLRRSSGIDPPLDLFGVEPQQVPPLDERDAAFGDESTDMAYLDAEPTRHRSDVAERALGVALHTNSKPFANPEAANFAPWCILCGDKFRGPETAFVPCPREGGIARLAGGTIGAMSQVEPVTNEEVAALDADERAWLDERLVEYDELLTYLREH